MLCVRAPLTGDSCRLADVHVSERPGQHDVVTLVGDADQNRELTIVGPVAHGDDLDRELSDLW